MKNFREFVFENLDHSEDEYTLVVSNTIHEIKSALEQELIDELEIYPFLYNTMIVVSDIGILSILRKELNIVSENLGNFYPEKHSYKLYLHVPKVYDIGRTHRIEKFLKSFKHPALNIEYLKNNSIEDQIMYDLNIVTMDNKENVLKYIRSALFYLNKGDGVLID
jgi:hypothetical protein